ncbi:hypothetical protein [Enterococcus casseliflavus]|uniref:hypothetical protein n=1 Tax=Enterococcus casseliflavus TaxID=37734 RepID=UPI00232DB4D5|nr:hypothetical protein [Enterococcus casseliflavus]MDB1688323.1 hypothetical protein [Enterococcus casseliflavus]
MFMSRYENAVRFVIKVGVSAFVLVFTFATGVKAVIEQSNFDNSIDSIQFSRKLAYDSNKEVKEYVDKNYVQQIIWKTNSLVEYPESISSRILFKREENQKSLEETLQDVMRLADDYTKKETD